MEHKDETFYVRSSLGIVEMRFEQLAELYAKELANYLEEKATFKVVEQD